MPAETGALDLLAGCLVGNDDTHPLQSDSLGVWACAFLHTVSWVSNSFQELGMFQEAAGSIPLFKEEKALSFALLELWTEHGNSK